MAEDNLDFEIVFFEKLLEKRPDFAEVLMILGEDYTKKGLYEKGLETDLRLAKLKPDDPSVHYNLACDHSLLKQDDFCLTALEKAIALGYRDFAHMQKDADLEFIRQDKRFAELLDKYKAKERV
jgi:tetratricopeptide (TPR) repeat protein